MIRALLVLIGLVAVVVCAAWVFQRSLIYLPSARNPDPAAAGLPGAEVVGIRTADGLELSGWFVAPPGPGPAAGVLVCNGNAGDRGDRAALAAALADMGLAVLLFDYRGYGGNPGTPSEAGLLLDAEAARAVLAARPEVDPDRLVYFGESLGAGVAAALAVEHPPAAMVLRSPFTALADVGSLHYPFLPVRALLRDRFPVAEQVRAYGGPLLVVAAADDGIVPPEQSRRVADAAPGPARFLLVEGAGHNDRALLDGPQLLGELDAFLREAGV